MASYAPSVCPHDCPSTCALEVERLSPSKIGRVRGAAENSYTAGVICEKVSRYAERVHHPDRLDAPLRRTGPKGSGQFEKIGWDEALDTIAAEFKAASEKHGTESVWPLFYAGTMGLVQRDGINRLRHVMRYSGQHATICVSISNAGWDAGVGERRGVDPREMAESDLIVVWGGNPVSTQVNVMTHIARARKARGAKLVVVDPYRSPSAAAADLHVMPRPGTDGALACAIMHICFRDGYADWDYLARYTDAPEELRDHMATRGPDWASSITGLSVAAIEEFAKLYGTTQRAYIRVGYGFARSRNGASNLHAVACLPAVTGKWQYKGGGALYSNSGLYKIDRTLIEGLDCIDPAIRVLDMSQIGPVLTGDAQALKGGPPVTAMLIQSHNPAVVAPESGLVAKGLAREDLFLAVHEQFMTETARYADIVLPATMFLEHDDLYQSSGHSHLQIGRQAIERLPGTRSNHEVLQDLAARLGARHAGFEMTALEIVDETLRRSNYGDVESLTESRWLDIQPDFRTSHFLDGFPTKDGKFHFKPDWASLGPDHARMPVLPDHLALIETGDGEHPFRLMTSPARAFLNSSFTETPSSRKRETRPTALLHPDDCAELGVNEGDQVALGNKRGRVLAHVRPFDGLQRKVVVVEGIWPGRDFAGGRGINTLVGADPAPPNGGAVFHDTAVWIAKADLALAAE
jgi:anaerobic selenocysteine-containing dehydrogenase